MHAYRSIAAALGLVIAGCSSIGQQKLEPVRHLDLPKYMGPWRVIAFVDNSAERRFTGSVESYELQPNARIGVTFTWRDKQLDGPKKEHRFTGQVVDPVTQAQWKMQLFPLVHASYVVIALDQRYKWAGVAHPSRKFGWVLARQPHLAEGTYQEILRSFRQQGYDTTKFVKVPQPSR